MHFLAIFILTASIAYAGPKGFNAKPQSDDSSVPFLEFTPEESETILNPSAFICEIILSDEEKKYNELKDIGLSHRTKKPKKRVANILFYNDTSTVTWKNIPINFIEKYISTYPSNPSFLSRDGTLAARRHDHINGTKVGAILLKYTGKKVYTVKFEDAIFNYKSCYAPRNYWLSKAISNNARFLAFIKDSLLLLIDYKNRKSENIDLLRKLEKKVKNIFFNNSSTQLTVEYEDKTSELFTVADSIKNIDDAMHTLREPRSPSSNNNQDSSSDEIESCHDESSSSDSGSSDSSSYETSSS